MDINKQSWPFFGRGFDQGTDKNKPSYPIFRIRFDQEREMMDINKLSYPLFRRRYHQVITTERQAMDYSSFNYFDVDYIIYFCHEDRLPLQTDEEEVVEFLKILASFKEDDVHQGLGYCPCEAENNYRRPNLMVHLFKDCASVIYGLSCFHGNLSKLKQAPRSLLEQGGIGMATWNKKSKRNPGTLVFRIDFVHIEPNFVKHDDADGPDDMKRDWRKNLYGLVGVRRRRVNEIGRNYAPAGIVFFRDLNDEISDNKKRPAVTADGQLLLSGPFLPLHIYRTESILLDIDLSCFVKSSERTLTFDMHSHCNRLPGLYTSFQVDKPKTCVADVLNGAVEVGYSIISRAVYVRFVASIIIPSTASPLDIYGHITVEEHFRMNQKSYLFYAERDSYQQLKHGDYLSFYMDSMTLKEGKELTINVSLYQRSPSSTSKSNDIIFVNNSTSFTPSVANHEEENQQEKKIQFDDHDQKGNGVNFVIGIMDPRYVRIIRT